MKLLLPAFLIFIIVSCSVETNKYSPDRLYSPKEKDALLWIVIRYLGKAPDGVFATDKFNSKYDSTYLNQLKSISFDAWQKKGDTCFFMVSRPVRNAAGKRFATGGKLVFDDDGRLRSYAEVFQTWKMAPDTLSTRSMILFDRMLTGEPLKPYETQNSNGIEYIELPNEFTYYDKEAREWRVRSN